MGVGRIARIALVVAALAGAALAWEAPHPRVLYEGDSPFNHLVVRDEGGSIRTLQFSRGGAIQSRVNVDDALDLKVPYTRASMLAWALKPDAKRILIIGLGGGAMPRYFHRLLPKAEIDVAELDPEVDRVARMYFALPDDARMKVHVGDGRKVVQDAKALWDLVLLDAYGDTEIPRHLATAEFLAEVKAHLAPGAVVAGNVWSRDHNVLYDAMARTWVEAFGAVCIVPVPQRSNRIFVSSPERAVSAAALREAAKRKAPGFTLAEYAPDECLSDADAGAPVLHDAQSEIRSP
jgi:spermidine synthase